MRSISDWVTTVIPFTAWAGGTHRILPKDGVIHAQSPARLANGTRLTGVRGGTVGDVYHRWTRTEVICNDDCLVRDSFTGVGGIVAERPTLRRWEVLAYCRKQITCSTPCSHSGVRVVGKQYISEWLSA